MVTEVPDLDEHQGIDQEGEVIQENLESHIHLARLGNYLQVKVLPQ